VKETGLSRNSIIAELSKSTHGELKEYIPTGKAAAEQHGEFFAHLIAWNRIKGQVRDSQVALPVVSLMAKNFAPEFIENSLAHLTMLGPRELLKALRFALDNRKELPLGNKLFAKHSGSDHRGILTRLTNVLAISLLEREKNWPRWERTMLQHRAVLKEMISLLHIKPCDQRTKACLYRCDKVDGKRIKLPYPEGGLFETVTRLKDMPPAEAAGTIMIRKIPFLIALGGLGKNAKEPDLVLALIKSMTATELVTNTKMLQELGVKTNPALRGAFQEALEKAGKSKANLLKTTRAAENIEDEELKENLRGLQEKQIQSLGGVEGNWLVLGDKSGSMQHCIETARHVAATLAKMVQGKVWLVFFDTSPQTIEVTGAALDHIKKATVYIQAGGGTSIGCGLQRMLDNNESVDGIAIVSDGCDNTPPLFWDVYSKYSKKFDKESPVYLYKLRGTDRPEFYQHFKAGHDFQEFDLTGSDIDFYSLPNLVSTMRTNRYSLIDEILGTRLLKLGDAYKNAAKAVSA
jgi:hypothetical protein